MPNCVKINAKRGRTYFIYLRFYKFFRTNFFVDFSFRLSYSLVVKSDGASLPPLPSSATG
jgi:hypothetical protein